MGNISEWVRENEETCSAIRIETFLFALLCVCVLLCSTEQTIKLLSFFLLRNILNEENEIYQKKAKENKS